MECPKCHSQISEKDTVCPKCHKVLLLECPNCHSLEDTAVCTQCGYKILIKCSKCGRINPAINDVCVKCGFSTKSSLAYQECESDEIAAVTIRFNNLKKIKRLLKTKDLYEKFYIKLKNLLLSQIKNAEGLFITYGDTFVLNFNKELSFPTSSNKAVRFALKLANTFTQLNLNMVEELGLPLGLNISVLRKQAEQLQDLCLINNQVKMLTVNKDIKKYLKGTQIVLDQYVWDEVNKTYKTDSLYSLEENGKSTTFYEIVLDGYILPPDTEKNNEPVNAVKYVLSKDKQKDDENQDLYSFNVFDINAKCKFDKTNAVSIKDTLNSIDLNKGGKIIALRSKPEYRADVSELVDIYKKKGYRVLLVSATEEMNYKPWGFFEKLFKEYYDLSQSGMVDKSKIPQQHLQAFKILFDLCDGKVARSASPEDSRFRYVEAWGKFLSMLSKTVIIADRFELIDDTTLQALELYYDKYLNVKPNFLFITSDEVSVHSKIKSLLKTPVYTELKLLKSSFANCLASIKLDASDFIGSFYFEKLQTNFKGSYLYFKYAVRYLMETGALLAFENKLLVKGAKSVVLPNSISDLYRALMKHVFKDKNLSDLFLYILLLNGRADVDSLKGVNIKDVDSAVKTLLNVSLLLKPGNSVIIANDIFIKEGAAFELNKDTNESELVKSIMSVLPRVASYDAMRALLLGRIKSYSEEYRLLCDNSDFSILAGDYDAYLKNCLGFLSLIDSVTSEIEEEDIDKRKKNVYNSILMYLYSYAPTKIYFIENILLMDAINENDDEKIVKLSNLMLQGALISSNYTDASGLLRNILTRMEHPTLLVDGVVNTKFLLLSMVNIEILYNLGRFRECVETAEDILSVLSIDIIDKIKPAGFSLNLFVNHILDTMRLVSFAKIYMADDNLDEFFEKITKSLDTDLPDKDCILALKDYLAGKVYNIRNVESYSPFSKVIFLILQEVSTLKDDYKRFAQNIFQAKLLAEEICQNEIKYLCDLLIAYAYSKTGITAKAEFIYEDVMNHSEKSAMFNILMMSKYLYAILKTDSSPETSLTAINDALSIIRNNDNVAALFYTMFEKLYINSADKYKIPNFDAEAEYRKLDPYRDVFGLITGAEVVPEPEEAQETTEE